MAQKNDSDVIALIALSFKSHWGLGYILGIVFFCLPELIAFIFEGNIFILFYLSILSIFLKIAGLLFILGGTYSLITNPKNENTIKAISAIVLAAVSAIFLASIFQPKEAKKQDMVKPAVVNSKPNSQESTVSNVKAAASANGPELGSLENNSQERWDRLGLETLLNRQLRPFQVKWNRSGACQIKGLSDAMSLPGRKYSYVIPTPEQRRQVYEAQYPYVVDAFSHNCVIKLDAFELQNEPVYSKYIAVKSQISSDSRCQPYFLSIDTAALSQYTDDIKIKHLSDILYDASVKQCLSKKNPLL